MEHRPRRRLRVPRVTVDLSALRASRELRWLVMGNFVSGLGTQAALVALPYQVYIQTRSALLTGLLGAVELGPLIAMALLGGALADRMDRRRLLLIDQIGLVAVPAALCAAALAGSPPLALLYVLGGLLAGFGALQNVARSAIVPNLVAREQMPAALAVNFGLYQLTMVIGPGLGGLLIAAAVLSGGLACVVAALLVAAAFPALARYDKEAALADPA
ncbi:MAG: MFS transporter [Solirubrobacteraceae bacterium]